MRVLLINGSPKGASSNSLRLASAFVDGMRDALAGIELRSRSVRSLDISPCKGCFVCWSKTPGKCCIHDDMASVLEDEQWADVTIWCFPLYYFSVPGSLKSLIDRQLPTSLPFMVDRSDGVGNGAHPSRVDRTGKRTVLVSTCGFYTAEGNYDAVTRMFDHICGRDNYETVFCGQGELFRVRELHARTGAYLSIVREAGGEFVTRGAISAETHARLGRLLYPKETYEAMANASWGIDEVVDVGDHMVAGGEGRAVAGATGAVAGGTGRAGEGGKAVTRGGAASPALTFTRQMALLYNTQSYAGKPRVIEMDYTDVNEVYQIRLGEHEATVSEGRPAAATMLIKTPLRVWQRIARGELEGVQALSQGLYTVEGDFSLMLEWDSVFGPGEGEDAAVPAAAQGGAGDVPASATPRKPPRMIASLLPLTLFWACVPIDATVGSMVVLAFCALEPLLFHRRELTIYDTASLTLASLFALAVLGGIDRMWVQPASYLLYGAMWAASCTTGVPFTAHYVKEGYGGDKAFRNPIFMECNRILTLAWAAVFVLNAAMVAVLFMTPVRAYSGLVVSALSLLMGIFTKWFQGFYPAWVAAGRKPLLQRRDLS